MHLPRKNSRFLLQAVLLARKESALLVGSPGLRASHKFGVRYDHLNEVFSLSVLDALVDELFELVACRFQVLFIKHYSGYEGLTLAYALPLLIERRRESFLFGDFELFLKIEHVTHVRLLSLLVGLEFFIEAINFLFFVGASMLRWGEGVFDGGADGAERFGVLFDEGAALDEEVLLFGVGDGALLEEGDLFGEFALGLLGLVDLCS